MNRLVLIALVALSSLSASAQIKREIGPADTVMAFKPSEIIKAGAPDTLDVSFERNFFHLDIGDGLCSRSIREVYVDSRNLLWVASNGGGVSIYNGKSFKNLTTLDGLPSDIVWDFQEDTDGRMWIATDAGVCIYDGREFEYITEEDGLGSDYCWSLFKDSRDRIFIGTAKGGFSVWDKGVLSTYFEILGDTAVPIKNFHEDHEGKIWIASWYGAVTWEGEDNFERRFAASRSRYSRVTLDLDLSFYEEDRIIWFATGDGLYKVSETDTIRYGKETGLPGDAFMDLHVDSEKNLWVGSTKGLIKWNAVAPVVLTVKQGMPDSYIQSMCEDQWGNLWIGTQSRGIAKYNGDRFTHLSQNTGIPGTIWALHEDSNEDVWIGMLEGGIVKFDGYHFLHYGADEGFSWPEIVSIEEDDDGRIWFGSRGRGLIRFDGENFEHFDNKNGVLKNQHVIAIRKRNDEMWLGTWFYMYKVVGDSIYIYDDQQNLIDHNIVLEFVLDGNNNLWAGTFGGGASLISDDEVLIINEEHGLPNSGVFSIFEDGFQNTWFVTSAGGVSILQKGWKSKPSEEWNWYHFNTSNGLASNEEAFVFIDSRGDAWVGSALGLNKIELHGKNIFDEDYKIRTYKEAEGFKGIASEGGCLEDGRGRFWIVSDDMLTIYDPTYDKKESMPPMLSITEMKLEMESVDWEGLADSVEYSSVNLWNNLPQDLKLDYDHNHVMFEFLGITYNSDKVEYSWKLDGFDASWSPWTSIQNATYANLPPGKYEFQLKARDGYGVVSETLNYSFEVEKAFYHTYWFRIGTVGVILLILFLLYKSRTVALKRRQKVLEQTVEERTEEISQQKSEIELQQAEILDSINYARRIQSAILPKDDFVQSVLPEAFIFYRPKDIVAGDFYWIEKVGDEIFIAAADCTGHGVPGAMVSVVCSNALNQAVVQEGIHDPGQILDRVTLLVIDRFKHGSDEVKDGMDIALCRWNKSKNELVFAGAFNPLWKYVPGKEDPVECEADKQPVGKFASKQPFTTKRVEVNKGDRFYMFSDGYADQFGGPRGKKFKSTNLKLLLATLSGLSPADQKARVEEVFDNWRGEFEQLDDVCLIGISV